jgi:hypothetical protein
MVQDLLYLQARSTAVYSEIIGRSLVTGGVVQELSDEMTEALYLTVGDALKDNWRIVKFPETALILDERRNYGLGCEFILERFAAGSATAD